MVAAWASWALSEAAGWGLSAETPGASHEQTKAKISRPRKTARDEDFGDRLMEGAPAAAPAPPGRSPGHTACTGPRNVAPPRAPGWGSRTSRAGACFVPR